MLDQASRLRELAAAYRSQAAGPPSHRHTRVIAVTSGKGGVGKTNLSINLAHALIGAGKEVMLLDADLGLANADILLGTIPPFNLGHLLRGEQDIFGLIHTTSTRLKLIAGGSGVEELADLGQPRLQQFLADIQRLDGQADYLFLDTGAGLNHVVLGFVLSADEVLLVTTPEPTSMADAYATIKSLHRRNPNVQVRLIINQAERPEEARDAAERLIATARNFLGLNVTVLGSVPRDPCVWQAVRSQRPFVLEYPLAPASRAVRAMGQILLAGNGDQAGPRESGGFFRRLASMLSRRAL